MTNIQPNLVASIPNLTTLVLNSNNFAELADLVPLRHFTKLTHLVLMENPVTRKEVPTFSEDRARDLLTHLLFRTTDLG